MLILPPSLLLLLLLVVLLLFQIDSCMEFMNYFQLFSISCLTSFCTFVFCFLSFFSLLGATEVAYG